MKSYDILEALNHVNDEFVTNAQASPVQTSVKTKRPLGLKWCAAAACVCLCAVLGTAAWQGGLPTIGTPASTSGRTGEFVLDEKYVYEIENGSFSDYFGGKVIDEAKLGGKLSEVTLTAGWRDAADTEWRSRETLRGELYAIKGIPSDVAVALKFIDKGAAVTVTHYYVMMNPEADLSAVADYIIQPIDGNAGDMVLE